MREYEVERIRRFPPAGVIPGSTPVPFFGDLNRAKVATLGWNPSDREFCEPLKEGEPQEIKRLLSGSRRRFETWESLGERNQSSPSPATMLRILDGCKNYFDNNPYFWFNRFERILSRLGVSYKGGTACHLDFVQWATQAKWGKLKRPQREALLEDDVPFLREQLSQEQIKLLLLNGSGLVEVCRERLGCSLRETSQLNRIGWKFYVGDISFAGPTEKTVKVIGWNKNLQSSFGVSNECVEAVAAAVEIAFRD
jgi:hypothetical protein